MSTPRLRHYGNILTHSLTHSLTHLLTHSHFFTFYCTACINSFIYRLEGNGFSEIEGLEQLVQLKSLYLQENLIDKVLTIVSLYLLTFSLTFDQ